MPGVTASAGTVTGSAVMGAGNAITFELRQRHEGHDPTPEDVRPGDANRAVGRLIFHHFQYVLRAGWTDWDYHDAAGLELLKQRRRDMIDPAGDDHLIERSDILPSVIAVGMLGGDRIIFGVAVGAQPIVDAARPLRQR